MGLRRTCVPEMEGQPEISQRRLGKLSELSRPPLGKQSEVSWRPTGRLEEVSKASPNAFSSTEIAHAAIVRNDIFDMHGASPNPNEMSKVLKEQARRRYPFSEICQQTLEAQQGFRQLKVEDDEAIAIGATKNACARLANHINTYMDERRVRGMAHDKTLKAVARKRLGVIYAIMRDKVSYSERDGSAENVRNSSPQPLTDL